VLVLVVVLVLGEVEAVLSSVRLERCTRCFRLDRDDDGVPGVDLAWAEEDIVFRVHSLGLRDLVTRFLLCSLTKFSKDVWNCRDPSSSTTTALGEHKAVSLRLIDASFSSDSSSSSIWVMAINASISSSIILALITDSR
jgi:hypothetical protein